MVSVWFWHKYTLRSCNSNIIYFLLKYLHIMETMLWPWVCFTALFIRLNDPTPSWLTTQRNKQHIHLDRGEMTLCVWTCYLAASVASLWHTCTPLGEPLSANRAEASRQLRPGLDSDSLEASKWAKQTLIPPPPLYLSRPLRHWGKGRQSWRNRKREEQNFNELEQKAALG